MDLSLDSNQTVTVDYSHLLQVKDPNPNFVHSFLETTIFQILKNHSDVFTFNDFEIYDIKSGSRAVMLENGVLIGSGGHGDVYYTYNPQTQQKAALKVQKDCSFQAVLQYAEEFKIQKIIEEIYPECIIKVQGKVFISQNYVDSYKMHTYLELGTGNLRSYTNRLSEVEIDNVFNCILDSIIKIHSIKIAHRDIKLDNILKTKENGWVLSDFGCSTQYQTPYGEYPILGTIQYYKKSIRQTYAQNQRKCKMNLFKNDIYAFQLVMLQIIYPEKSMIELNTILDEKKMVHPRINQLYDKDYFIIKRDFSKIKYTRQSTILDDDLNIHFDKAAQDTRLDPLAQFAFSFFSFAKQLSVFQSIFLKLYFEEYQQEKQDTIRTAYLMKSFVLNYYQFKTVQEIFDQIQFEKLSKLEYDLYYDVFGRRGSKILQLMLCQRYQQILGNNNSNLLLQEAEILYIMCLWDDAKSIINSIKDPSLLESDEAILKYCCLKARLNNLWVENHDDIIKYLRNYKETFQILFEWKFLLIDSIWMDRYKGKVNKIYKKYYRIKKDILEQNTDSDSIKETFQVINLVKFGEKPLVDNEDQKYKNFISQLKKPLTQVSLMKDYMNYDNYSIFYYNWTYLEGVDVYGEGFRNNIEDFIQFIEENLQGYYFNWVIFDLYSQHLTYRNEFKKAELYNQKALDIVKNDCVFHQLIVHHHLFRLKFKQRTQDRFPDCINLLPSSNLRFYYARYIQEEEGIQWPEGIDMQTLFKWEISHLNADDRKYLDLNSEYLSNKLMILQDQNFHKFKQHMNQFLPNLVEYIKCMVLPEFYELIKVAQQTGQPYKLVRILIQRYLTLKIIYNQIGGALNQVSCNYDDEYFAYVRHCIEDNDEPEQEVIPISKYFFYCESQL
ncbi:unnamed protein product (macronuclear) [Paramecium tetraurelia]|uniref:non-specific serine/threonine protein kinase n=1 Tax=Paramecium tetraurelia TaxID=5888 RepID=A0C1C0_PARTE|nr:uncharacterized protein GSPATT00034063001 [Paramecium tetraurelia]CAK64587.1 unnamed protein product [Paramecium tetraurelia]|eukprot:XP_001431985.1 hypothetical protein (macronuclear) [Paramecium tetraurelia strain d4-2]